MTDQTPHPLDPVPPRLGLGEPRLPLPEWIGPECPAWLSNLPQQPPRPGNAATRLVADAEIDIPDPPTDTARTPGIFRHSDAVSSGQDWDLREWNLGVAQVWTDPESAHPGPSVVVTDTGVDPETRLPRHPQYRDWLPHHHDAAAVDVLASAETALGAAGWEVSIWTRDETGWRAPVTQRTIFQHLSDITPAASADETGGDRA